MTFEDRPLIDVIMKPWGFEKRIINAEAYCGKMLYVVKGRQTSLHFHKTKDETFFVHSGKIRVYYCDSMSELNKRLVEHGHAMHLAQWAIDSVTLKPGDNFRIPPERIHQVYAMEDTQLYEFSTKHEESDTVRLAEGGINGQEVR